MRFSSTCGLNVCGSLFHFFTMLPRCASSPLLSCLFPLSSLAFCNPLPSRLLVYLLLTSLDLPAVLFPCLCPLPSLPFVPFYLTLLARALPPFSSRSLPSLSHFPRSLPSSCPFVSHVSLHFRCFPLSSPTLCHCCEIRSASREVYDLRALHTSLHVAPHWLFMIHDEDVP